MVAPGIPSDLVLINGPLLLGTLFSYGLFGILVVQLYMYHSRFPNDRVWTKLLVWTVFIADIVLTVLPTIIIWRSLVSGWGDVTTIGLFEWPFIGITIASGYVSTSVRIFFCWRIWKLRQSCILPCIMVAISFVAWSMELICGIRGVMIGITRVHELESYVIVWLVGSAFCDITITVTLITILVTRGSQTGFKELSSIIRRLIQLTVETALITTIGAISELVIFTIFPHNNMHFLVYFTIAKLYTNSLLTTLNARSYINPVNMSISMPLWEDQLKMTSEFCHGGTFGTSSQVANGVYTTTFSEHLENRHDRCGPTNDITVGNEEGEHDVAVRVAV